jgi:hypothetical protein
MPEGELHPDLELLLEFYNRQRSAPPDAFAHSPGLMPSPDFFSIEKLQAHLNNPLLTPDWIALAARGQFVPLEPAYMFKDVQNKQLFFMDKALIDQHLREGAALLLEGLDVLDASINAFAARVDAALPCALTNVVAFFSQRGNEAYKGHADLDDVLVVHIEGEKRWSLFEPRPRKLKDKGGLTKEQMGRQIGDVMMRPGDALYVRAGIPHICQTTGECSLHLSFDLRDRTLSVKQITEEANTRYAAAAAAPYAEPSKVIEKYVELLTSEKFQSDVAAATSQIRDDALGFRRRIGKTSVVRALSKFAAATRGPR